MNSDAVWGREPATVDATLRATKPLVQLWDSVRITTSLLPPRGPFPVADSFGVAVAKGVVLKSLEPGCYVSHQLFETIRKLRAGFSNMYMSSLEGSNNMRMVGGDRAKYQVTHNPTQFAWFERFSLGCLRRMSQEVRQDWAIPLPVMHALMKCLDHEWSKTIDQEASILVASVGAYSIIAFCGSFRGSEVFLVDLHGLQKYITSLH